MKKQLYFAAVLTTFIFDSSDALSLENGTLLKPSSNSVIYTLHVEQGLEMSAHYTKAEFELLKKKIEIFTHLDKAYSTPQDYHLMEEVRELLNRPNSNPFLAIVKLEKLFYGYNIQLKEALSQEPIAHNPAPLNLKKYIDSRIEGILETLERSLSSQQHLGQTMKWRIQNNFYNLREISTLPSIQKELYNLESMQSDSFYSYFYKLQGALVCAQAELWWKIEEAHKSQLHPSIQEIISFLNSIREKNNTHPFPFIEYNFTTYKALFKNLFDADLLKQDMAENSFNVLDFPGKYSLQKSGTLEWDILLLENCIELLQNILYKENDKPLLLGISSYKWNEHNTSSVPTVNFYAYAEEKLIREEEYVIENNEKLHELKNNIQSMIDKLSDNFPNDKEIKEIKDTFYDNQFASIPSVLQALNKTYPVKQSNDIEVYKVMQAPSLLDYLIEYYKELEQRIFPTQITPLNNLENPHDNV